MGQGTEVWILLLQWEGAICSTKMSLGSIIFITGKGTWVPLSQVHTEKVEDAMGHSQGNMHFLTTPALLQLS